MDDTGIYTDREPRKQVEFGLGRNSDKSISDSVSLTQRIAFTFRIAADRYAVQGLTNKDMSRAAATYPIVEQARLAGLYIVNK